MAALTGGLGVGSPAGWLVAAGSVLAACGGRRVASADAGAGRHARQPQPARGGRHGSGLRGGVDARDVHVRARASSRCPSPRASSRRRRARAAVAATWSPSPLRSSGCSCSGAASSLATARLRGAEEQLVQKVTPAR
ncbi:MAG: hypothetical protein V9E94_17445 [Microthrixaceae bacterium]